MDESAFAVGVHVRTPFGKGVVREVRNNGRLLVEIGSRSLVIQATTVSRLDPPKPGRRAKNPPAMVAREASHGPPGLDTLRDCDLHGFAVADALAHADAAINDAIMNGHSGIRLIHGRSGGKIRGALHRHLSTLPSVRAFRLDPRNSGVTIVEF